MTTADDRVEPPWWTPPKTTVRRTLDRTAIVAAARGVLRADGMDALSMRRVAAALGTGPASLYAHVAHKEELLELLYDDVVGEVPVPTPDPPRWREQLTRLWVDAHAALARNGDIARFSLGRVPMGPNSLRLAETSMTLLRAGGVPDQAVAWAVDVVGHYLSAQAVERSVEAGLERAGRDPDEYYAQVGRFFAGLPVDRFPTVTALQPLLTVGDSQERFRFGLDLLVGGLASMAGESGPADPAPRAGDQQSGPDRGE